LVQVTETDWEAVKKYKILIPVYERYGKIMELLNRNEEAARKWREELVGPDIIAESTDLYDDGLLAKGLGITLRAFHKWKKEDIRELALAVAQLKLQQMVDFLGRYDAHKKSKQKSEEKRLTSKNKGAAKR